MSTWPTVFVWGGGRCGRSLAVALHAAGVPVAGLWNRTEAASRHAGPLPVPTFWGEAVPAAVGLAEVVWLTVPDDVIATEAARVLAPHHVALHAAGAVPASALRAAGPRSAAACHPLQSFPNAVATPDHVARSTFGLQGDAEAVAVARALVEAMGARWFEVSDPTAKALTHAACCLASNALVALVDRAVAVFAAAGVSRTEALRALWPLIAGTVDNLAHVDEPRDALTGPIQRGQPGVIEAHLRALRERAPDLLAPYVAAGREIQRLVPESDAQRAIGEALSRALAAQDAEPT